MNHELEEYVKYIKKQRTTIDTRHLLSQRKKGTIVKWILVPLVIVVLSFTIAINTIPTFAQTMSNIPFLKEVLETLKFNPGIIEAVENDYLQKIGLSQSKQ